MFDLANLSLMDSLSNDHLSLCEEDTSSVNVRVDQPSEDPPRDRPIDKSLSDMESTKDCLPSGELFSLRDLSFGILLSETCLERGKPGERRACLDEVGSARRARVLEDDGCKPSADEDGDEATEIEGLLSEAAEIAKLPDSMVPFSSVDEMLPMDSSAAPSLVSLVTPDFTRDFSATPDRGLPSLETPSVSESDPLLISEIASP